MSRVGIDLDGVCYDFANSLREYLVYYGIRQWHECPPTTRWEFYEDWGFTLDEFLEHCNEGVYRGFVFTIGAPYLGTAEALGNLWDRGHSLHVITDRPFGRDGVTSEGATRSWLNRHHLPFDSLHFTSNKAMVRVDYMIDDKIENYDALDDFGSKTYLLDRPWNQDDGTRRRVKTLAEFAAVVG